MKNFNVRNYILNIDKNELQISPQNIDSKFFIRKNISAILFKKEQDHYILNPQNLPDHTYFANPNFRGKINSWYFNEEFIVSIISNRALCILNSNVDKGIGIDLMINNLHWIDKHFNTSPPLTLDDIENKSSSMTNNIERFNKNLSRYMISKQATPDISVSFNPDHFPPWWRVGDFNMENYDRYE